MCIVGVVKWSVAVAVLLSLQFTNAVVLRAYISQYGLHGEIEFSQKNQTTVSIRTNLKPTLEFPEQIWRWAIHEFPVDYTDITKDRCSDDHLGKELIDLTEEMGFLEIPDRNHAEFESANSLTGEKGLWGKSLVLKTEDTDRVICANIVSNDRTVERVAVAKFNGAISGSVFFRWIASKEFDHADTFIQTDLYYTKAPQTNLPFTEHKWKIYVTDIFDKDDTKVEQNCNVLQLVFDPESNGNNRAIGDIDARLGKLKVTTDAVKYRSKVLLKDDGLMLLPSDLAGPHRSLYLVLFDPKHSDSFLGCAKIRHLSPRVLKALIDLDGVRGEVEFSQQSRFDPTWARFSLAASDGRYESSLKYASSVVSYQVNELPPMPTVHADQVRQACNDTGNTYNPLRVDLKKVPPSGMGTQDQYPIGDLLGKLKGRTDYINHKYLLPGLSNELSGSYWDIFLPLEGPHSILHRSVSIKRNLGKLPICGPLVLYEHDTKFQTEILTAKVLFRYPIVGRVLLRQPKDRPWEDTTVLVEYIIHADGANLNNSFQHRWAVHEKAPGQDFYNWTGRCLSAGQVYNPHQVDVEEHPPEEDCNFKQIGLCRVGDLSTRHGYLDVAGSKKESSRISRKLFTDTVLPLSGPHSIIGKCLLIYDDHGPVARGERMACAAISVLYRRKAVVKDWFGNNYNSAAVGKIEFLQQTEYDHTNVEVDLEDLEDAGAYHVHVAPVESDLEFPCEKSTLYDNFNPFKIDPKSSPAPSKGTPDQYQLGDLSGKFGSIDGQSKYMTSYNDSQLSLFGQWSILGRSVVIHKKNQESRWSCASIERGYSPSEARELRAIASFHHPDGFGYGYVRMTQLIYNDGSQSDTIIEVKLRHPGLNDRNVTRDHKWAIFVNPVGVDASVKTFNTRCVAGGYRWNPYYTQLADPLNEELYNQECGPDNPLRCHVGDLSARLGPINMGLSRQMFVDGNFPLEGKQNAIGRSIVIFAPNFSNDRFACANIEPDNDIIKYANIMKPPRFSLDQFISDVREIMGVPEWMITTDSRKTKYLHQGQCVQFLLHFKGANAGRLELDFSKILATGRLDEPSISIAGYINDKRPKLIQYRQCGVREPTERSRSFQTSIFSSRNAGPPQMSNAITKLAMLAQIVCYFCFTVAIIN